MPVNLLNEKELNDYLTDIVYQDMLQSSINSASLESLDFIRDNKDAVIRSISLQWFKHRVRAYLSDRNDAEYLRPVKQIKNGPEWVNRTLSEGHKIYRFDPHKVPFDLRHNLENIRDFLYLKTETYLDREIKRAENTGKKIKIRLDYLKTTNEFSNVPMVLEKAESWYRILATKEAEKKRRQKLFDDAVSGTRAVMQFSEGINVVQLSTKEALDFESEEMGNCVGKGGYDEIVENGKSQIYSFRDKNGHPHVTMEIKNGKMHQCKGKENKAPVQKYIPYILSFLEKKNIEPLRDKENLGFFEQDNKLYNIWHLPKGFIFKKNLNLQEMLPNLINEMPNLSECFVWGNFSCANLGLTSLKGCPKQICGHFDCSDNNLTDLKYAPQKGVKDFYCYNNKLTSLYGAPKKIKGCFDCSNNCLTSLEGCPSKIKSSLDCSINHLTTLKGSPKKINGFMACSENKLTSLLYAPVIVKGDFCCSENCLTSLQGAPLFVGRYFSCDNNLLTSLRFSPKIVKNSFFCYNNRLQSLYGAPRIIRNTFDCSYNFLTDLRYAPMKIQGNFNCICNQLKSLKGMPTQVDGKVNYDQNPLSEQQVVPIEQKGFLQKIFSHHNYQKD